MDNPSLAQARREFWEKVFIAEMRISSEVPVEGIRARADRALAQWDDVWIEKDPHIDITVHPRGGSLTVGPTPDYLR